MRISNTDHAPNNSKKKHISFIFELKITKIAIYKNVHNVQNFVYNYKNNHFNFKSAKTPDNSSI